MEIGELISRYRKDAGMTIDELVAASGVPKGTLNKIINGNNLEKIKRRVRHVFLIKGKYYNESYLLSKKFD